MTKLNDLQLIMLTAAAQRDDGSLLPPPEHLSDQSARIRKTIPPLIKYGFVEERPTEDQLKVWREAIDKRVALFITDAGRSAIGVEPEANDAGTRESPFVKSKSDLVLQMLGRQEGASLNELVEVTNWLPHSMRAALTGLRKKGHQIALDRTGDRHVYRLSTSIQA